MSEKAIKTDMIFNEPKPKPRLTRLEYYSSERRLYEVTPKSNMELSEFKNRYRTERSRA